MYYHQIIHQDTANGPGIRLSLFVSGCAHGCPGCHNQKGQDFMFGEPFTEETIQEILDEFHNFPLYGGISILGGEPLHPHNAQSVARLLAAFHDEFPHKTVWVYTGFIYEELVHTEAINDILRCTDILVDGPFIEAQKDLTLSFRGSANQRVIDVQASLAAGSAVALSIDQDRGFKKDAP